MLLRSEITAGHIFYYVRKSDIHLNKVDLENKTYERITDFGIVPITFINGYLPGAHDYFMRNFAYKEIINQSQIKHISFQSGIINLFNSTGTPWFLYADQICPNYYEADILKDDNSINISNFRYGEIIYMENYAEMYSDLIAEIEAKYYKPIEFIVKNLGKEYEFLYDVFYDALEIWFWHGTRRGFNTIQFVLDSILQEEIINKLPEIGGFFWKYGTEVSKINEDVNSFISKIIEEENKEIEKRKKEKRRNMQKGKIIKS